MSVTISEYLKSHDNKLTALLKSEDLNGLFLDDTLIKVQSRDDEWWCDIILDYTLSCNDLAAIADGLAGYWWCISPYGKYRHYRFSICLKDVRL